VAAWRQREAVRLTLRRRPDVIIASWSSLAHEVRRVVLEVAREEGISLPPVEG